MLLEESSAAELFGIECVCRCAACWRVGLLELGGQESSAAELFGIECVCRWAACWRFGLLELGGQDRLAPAIWDTVGHAAIWPTRRHSPLRAASSPWRYRQP